MSGVSDEPVSSASLLRAVASWFQDNAARHGIVRTVGRFFVLCWEFVRDSMPSRRRQRYGDVDFDWDFRVDTSGATVCWRDRLLGQFHSPYQPTDPVLFRAMLKSLNLEFAEFTFIDIGSGKGRVLLMASDFPFRRVLGVELLPELHRIAQENIRRYKRDPQQCFQVESLAADAREFAFPDEPLLLYLFNPLPETGLETLLANLEVSLRDHPRPAYLLYHNPLLERVLLSQTWLTKIGGTHQYSLFAAVATSLKK